MRVVFATDLTTADGKTRKADSEGTVDSGEGRMLISRGLARPAETTTKKKEA